MCVDWHHQSAVLLLLLPPHFCSGTRPCAAAPWLALLAYLLAITPCAAQLGRPPTPAAPAPAAGATGAGAAECSLFILGGKGRILRAGMKCTGPQPTIALALPHMTGHMSNLPGVATTSSCYKETTDDEDTPLCLVSICAGGLQLNGAPCQGFRALIVTYLGCCVGWVTALLKCTPALFLGTVTHL